MNDQTKIIEHEATLANQLETLPDDAGGKNKLTKIEAVRAAFDRMGEQFKLALPAHIPAERFVRVTMTALQANPMLLDCDRRSLYAAAMKCAQDGLLPDGRLAAFVPFNGQVQYMPMVAGLLKKVRNSGELMSIAAHVAFENDTFRYTLGDDERIDHQPLLDGDRGKPKLVYAIARTKDGGVYREIMTVAEVEKVRAVSRAANKGPWVTWWEEMARKTVVRRLSKYLPMSTDLDDLIRRDDELYDFASAKAAADAVSAPKTEVARQTLDSFANAPAAKPSGRKAGAPVHAHAQVVEHDADTGEIAEDENESTGLPQPTSPTTSPMAAAGNAAPQQDAQNQGSPRVEPGAAEPDRSVEAKPDPAPTPTTEREYVAHANAWREALTDAGSGEARWKIEKQLRNKCNVGGEIRDDLQEKLNARVAELRRLEHKA